MIAAVQVVLFHVQFNLHPKLGVLAAPLRRVLGPLSGVPIFFMISGFLVSASFERRRDLVGYARSRLARIYPALLVCLAVTVLMLALEGYLTPIWAHPKFAAWIVAQATIGQSAHLEAFRRFGTGIPNGSLWTISVEVLFYAGLPFVYFLMIDRVTRRSANIALGAFGLVSFVIATAMVIADPNSHEIATKLTAQTPIPYLYLFFIGVVVQRNFDAVSLWIVGKVAWWALAYYAIVSLVPTHTCTVALGWCANQSTAPDAGLLLLSQVVLAGLVFSFAFSIPNLSSRVLKGNDPSYGTYLFHMLLVNVALAAGEVDNSWIAPAVVVGAVGIGWLSWKVVEAPALRRWREPRSNLGASPGVAVVDHDDPGVRGRQPERWPGRGDHRGLPRRRTGGTRAGLTRRSRSPKVPELLDGSRDRRLAP